MAGTEWVTTEQKAFLQELYNEFLKAQLHSTLSAFWTEVYRGWFEKWPEISVIYPDVPNHESLTDEQKKTLGVAVKKRQQVGVILVQNSQMPNNSPCSNSGRGSTTDRKGVAVHRLMQ